HTATNRTLTWHPIGLVHLKALITTWYDFAFPTPLPLQMKAMYLAFFAILGLSALVLLARQNVFRRPAAVVRLTLPGLYLLFVVVYLAVLLLSLSLLDAQIPLDNRLLLPAGVLMLVVVLALAWAVADVLRSQAIWYGCLILLICSIAVNGPRALA